ncbi:TPA_asm: adenain [Monosiga MELD virus 1]|nr:TPA_asm: adenain [Monosiga MELD virus 1]
MSSGGQLTAWLADKAQDNILKRNKVFYGGVFAADELPDVNELKREMRLNGRRGVRIIVNYSDGDERGTHWCGMGLSPQGRPEYFDSYGMGPDADDAILAQQEGHPFHTHFRAWLHSLSASPLVWNKTRLQASGSDVCGNYSAYYVLWGLPTSYDGVRAWYDVTKVSTYEGRDKQIARLVRLPPRVEDNQK